MLAPFGSGEPAFPPPWIFRSHQHASLRRPSVKIRRRTWLCSTLALTILVGVLVLDRPGLREPGGASQQTPSPGDVATPTVPSTSDGAGQGNGGRLEVDRAHLPGPTGSSGPVTDTSLPALVSPSVSTGGAQPTIDPNR